MLKKFTWIAALFAALAMVFAGCSNFGVLDDDSGPKPADDLEISGAEITLTAIGGSSSTVTIDKNKVTLKGTTSAGFYYEFPAEAAEYTNFELYFKVLEIKSGKPGLLIKRNTQMQNPIGITDNDDPEYQLNDADSPAKGSFPAAEGLHYEVGETYTTGVWKKNRFDNGIAFQHQAWNPGDNAGAEYTLEVTLVVFIGGGGTAAPPPPEYVGDNTKVVFTKGATAALDKVVDNDPSVTGAGVTIDKDGWVSFDNAGVTSNGGGSVSYKFPESYTVGTKKDAVTTPLDIEGDYDFVEIEYEVSDLDLTKGSSFKVKLVQYGGGWDGGAYGGSAWQDFGGEGKGTYSAQTWGAGGKGGIQIHYNAGDINGTLKFKITKVTYTKGTRNKVSFYVDNNPPAVYEVLSTRNISDSNIPNSVTAPKRDGWTFRGWRDTKADADGLTGTKYNLAQTISTDTSLFAAFEAVVLPPITHNATETSNLFVPVGNYASADAVTYDGKQWLIVANADFGWATFTPPDTFTPAEIAAFTAAHPAGQASRVGYVFVGDEAQYDNCRITYESVLIGSNPGASEANDEPWGVVVRKNANGASGSDDLSYPWLNATTFSGATSGAAGISVVKNKEGAFLIRVTKIEFYND
jgi:hypothetical protein